MGGALRARILDVDLTTGLVAEMTVPEDVYRQYPGGSALAVYLLLREMKPGVDPLSPENVLVFAVSPFTALPVAGVSRVVVAAKSPLTGMVGDSQAGGYFPAFLKAAGWDAIIFRGRSPEPVYLSITAGGPGLRPAGHLWGRVTGEVEPLIRAELGDPRAEVAQVGPAGEKLVRYAAIVNRCTRASGRTGMGAVMGSKNLKAVAVSADPPTKPVHRERFKRLAARARLAVTDPVQVRFGKFGTSGSIAPQNKRGGLATRNYTSGIFEGADKIKGSTMYETILKSRETCFACPLRCKRVVEVHEPYQVDPTYGGPEYETCATFGSYCGIDDLAAIAKANEICNKYGMDTISCGATIAFAMECYERGLIDTSTTEGIQLNFGNAAAMVSLVEMIAARKGFGDLLAEGSARAAQVIGKEADELVMAVKGLELPAHMPQVKRSLAVIYAVNPFGADHQSSEHDTALTYPEESEARRRLAKLGITKSLDQVDLSPEKVRFAYYTQVFTSLCDTLCLCQFVWGLSWQMYGPDDMIDLVEAGTGWPTSLWELMKVGERRLNLLRLFNMREGFDRKVDTLPPRVFKALPDGPSRGLRVEEEDFRRAVELYYGMAGWDPATGNPRREKLLELGLAWVLENGTG